MEEEEKRYARRTVFQEKFPVACALLIRRIGSSLIAACFIKV